MITPAATARSGRSRRVYVASMVCILGMPGVVRISRAAERPVLPAMTAPVLFNTAEADRILASLQVFPPDNPWNEDITSRPLLPNSAAMVAAIGADKKLAYNLDMGFVLVPANQPRVAVKVRLYPDESDPGPFPLPSCAPIEGWPLDGRSLDAAQTARENADRHVIVVDPAHHQLFEFYQGRRTDTGWECACAAVFDLASNRQRPVGWTSADAAGLPVFPAVIRYDEVERGMVGHAMRFTVRNTRNSYVEPATHCASRKSNPDFPRMGERFRLRPGFRVDGFSPHVRAILLGLKKHGMFVADNGGDWRISVAPDSRIKGLDELRRLTGADFEVITPSGPGHGSQRK